MNTVTATSSHRRSSNCVQAEKMQRYYRFHSKIYNLTRWTFLFGRNRIIDLIPNNAVPKHILEVGCGTGRNLLQLANKFPMSDITGIDISTAMLEVADKNVFLCDNAIDLIKYNYNQPLKPNSYDLVLFSYSLTMINPGWREALACAYQDLAPGGYIAVVDFHNTPIRAFQRWMEVNHVRMESHLLPELENMFDPETVEINHAYCGSWNYLMFLGTKPHTGYC